MRDGDIFEWTRYWRCYSFVSLPQSRWATFRTSLGSIHLLRCAAIRFVAPLTTALGDFFAGDRRRRGVSTGILFPACCRLDRVYVYLS